MNPHAGALVARTEQLLDELGDSAHAVAARLIELECKGALEDAGGCPVFYYLRRANLPVDRVTDTDVVLTWDGQCEHVTLTQVVSMFIDQFDREVWPELIDEPEDPS